MSNNFEHLEINRFYTNLLQDIRSIQLTEEDGGSLEQIFTQASIDLLADAGETENARPAYDEKALGTKNQHKINGYAISENYETLDLFLTIFKGYDNPEKITKEEVETASKRILNFFRKAVYKEYSNELEESSEIFQFAQTLSRSEELKNNLVRVNAIIISDGLYSGVIPANENISGYPVYFRVIDLNYLYNITEKSHVPIEIDFNKEGFSIPCIASPVFNEDYRSYLAIISGSALALIYERFGARLLEQNVRSFLQFTGKINNGIRKTIISEPQMFLAFNNGIAATADEIVTGTDVDGGSVILSVKDLQIVNGGQTTASIYHTWKKDKADISGIQVQLKLSVIKKKDNLGLIVSRISEYANTQNKVSISDLSSNKPFHIELEKISRSTVTPHNDTLPTQTKWFYERARGQYKNARLKDGFTTARANAFDIKIPRKQVFNKEDLAKFENSWQEKYDGKKLVIGPHIVVRGNQKNYVQFINFAVEKPDSIFFEDAVAKGIIFKAAEKLYGVKPNSIGDMRYVTVPYAIAYFAYKTNYMLDLFKIWKIQAISNTLSEILYEIMEKVEIFIKKNAPGSLYGEWAKKEECWNAVKRADFKVNFNDLVNDFINAKSSQQRKKLAIEAADDLLLQEEIERIRSVSPKIWQKIEEWGTITGSLSDQQKNYCFNLSGRVRAQTEITDNERKAGLKILDLVITSAPGLLSEIDIPEKKLDSGPPVVPTLDLIHKLLAWDRKNKKLRGLDYQFLASICSGEKSLTESNKKIVVLNIQKAVKYGFEI